MSKLKSQDSLQNKELKQISQRQTSIDPVITGTTFQNEKFIVPQTYDMVRALFDPTLRKSLFEVIILLLLSTNGLIYYYTPSQLRIKIFIIIYFFWRISYNFGIGVVLYNQSNHNHLVKLSKKFGLFQKSNAQSNWFQRLINYEIYTKMGPSYVIESHPVEFNTWLIFRKFVDLILMQDFTAFIFLVLSAATYKDNFKDQIWYLSAVRFTVGTVFILFNLWVKINAHNTVKDYAWYWGDFFFLQDTELTFDGVFEMVPHPMYSIGYIGYYGFALISKSYTVLIVSLIAHFMQMAFLIWVENPHIDKIYPSNIEDVNINLSYFSNLKPLVGFKNFTWARSSDLLNLVLALYAIITPVFLPQTGTVNCIVFGITLSIKLLESVIINTILFNQSNYKSWTLSYLLKDFTIDQSFNKFVIFYNSFLNLTYFSFISLAIREYSNSNYLFNDFILLRIILGLLMISLQIWTNYSIVDSIGYFGWFYGDFFIPTSNSDVSGKKQLTDVGIYRYLNNPEKVLGISGIWGVFLIIPTYYILILSGVWTLNNFIMINIIEKPHMIKLYGFQNVFKESGVSKTFKKHLFNFENKNGIENAENVIAEEGYELKINKFLKDLHDLNFKNSVDKELILNLSNELINESDFLIEVLNLKKQSLRRESMSTNSKSKDEYYESNYVTVGEPIKLKWSAPYSDPKDWIGLYKVVNTGGSRKKTLITSSGHWLGTSNSYNQYESDGILEVSKNTGLVEFGKNKLYWEEGIYEFRYHSGDTHNVSYITKPFEIKGNPINVPKVLDSANISRLSKDLTDKIFDKIVPGFQNGTKFTNSDAKKVVKLIKYSTDIEIDSELITDDVPKLCEKLIKVRQILDNFGSS